ncbi:MAG: DmsE family decaheme c-type cytochrome [bacterium]|nr:DmsE family decaheme c-type cytochrome [bacterium]
MSRKLCALFVIALAISACETLKTSKPILPIKSYERMLAGRLDANYIGTDKCLAACHAHDALRRDFEASTMGAQLADRSNVPLVDCESCHGPGSLAVQGLTPEKVAEDARQGVTTRCNHETLLDIENLPAGAQSLICLKCHSANATFNLHNWNAGEHAVHDVSCSDCHAMHQGPDLKVEPRDTAELCFTCHQDIQAEFYLPSRHPVPEDRVFCNDCHDQHGSVNDSGLREDTVKEVCTRCHGEKEGPFLYEHAENTEDCSTCHRPHGSVNNNLLTVQVPFLCLQCHAGHRAGMGDTIEGKGAFYTRCTDCHSQVHGSDIPSTTGKGRFIQ